MGAIVHEELRVEFIRAATWHGPLDRADAMLAAEPALARSGIHVAAILGDVASVRASLAENPQGASATSAPYGANALTLLSLSKYLRLDASRSEAFVECAQLLLDAGADANAGFWTTGDFPEHETPLYGAAGVAHDARLTRLLLAHGADPNDEEAVYHSPESYDLTAMGALVETGRVTPENLALMLVRKADWHDVEGARYLLEHGADARTVWPRGASALAHAIERDNDLAMIELLLEHGADPLHADDGRNAFQRSAARGRGDVLRAFERRGVSSPASGLDAVVRACALGDDAAARRLAAGAAGIVRELRGLGGTLLGDFAGNGNVAGARTLLDLGVDVNARYPGYAYYDRAEGTALHVAAWHMQHDVVKLLLARGASADEPDARGRTPLVLAVKACVDSYWMRRRRPDSIRALIAAGASADGIPLPTGYDEADALLTAMR